jgi:hypothetical protein
MDGNKTRRRGQRSSFGCVGPRGEQNEEFPNYLSGKIPDTDETWCGINLALQRGTRGFSGKSSLVQFLKKHRGKRNLKDLPDLKTEWILEKADAWYKKHREFPKTESGRIPGTDENWRNVQNALSKGYRGHPGGSSLAKFLKKHRGKRNLQDLPKLTIKQILEWGDAWYEEHDEFPAIDSGDVPGTGETWNAIHLALDRGNRRLPGGSSLPKLLEKYRGFRNPHNTVNKSALTTEQILEWVDAWYEEHEEFPKRDSGNIPGTDENWNAIDAALRRGNRELPGGSSLPKLLKNR